MSYRIPYDRLRAPRPFSWPTPQAVTDEKLFSPLRPAIAWCAYCETSYPEVRGAGVAEWVRMHRAFECPATERKPQ